MKRTWKFNIIGILLVTIFGCNSSKPQAEKEASEVSLSLSQKKVIDEQTSEKTLDWNGTYSGILPCADCDGIKTKITLLKDSTFTKSMEYLGKGETTFFERGTFVWNDSGNIIILTEENGKQQQYKVDENILFHLDKKGNVIAGDLAEKYKLTKNLCDKNLENTKWVLTELKGSKIELLNTPYIFFDNEKAIFSGNDGCNSFSGIYELKQGCRINIPKDKIVSTEMACDNMETSNLFIKELCLSDNYVVKEGILSLNKARMAPLAKFKKLKE